MSSKQVKPRAMYLRDESGKEVVCIATQRVEDRLHYALSIVSSKPDPETQVADVFDRHLALRIAFGRLEVGQHRKRLIGRLVGELPIMPGVTRLMVQEIARNERLPNGPRAAAHNWLTAHPEQEYVEGAASDWEPRTR